MVRKSTRNSNPNALESTKKNTIFTNVVLKRDGTVWWEGMDKDPPTDAVNWKGEPWDPTDGSKGAHPNSRFTAPAENCPCISPKFNDPQGVPISAIIFGGRRAKTVPLVYQSKSWAHGVFTGSVMGSEKTAAAEGQVGELRRDPMAMLPFCGYHMADYWQHWLDMESKLTDPPKIFNVNWFRTDDTGSFLWPGFGENLRALEWILGRCDGTAEATETPVGYVPRPEDIDLTGLEDQVSPETLRELLTVDPAAWKDEVADIRAHYARFGDRLPAELQGCLAALEAWAG